ncbi:hypothetical protein WJN01_04350 [Flavobacteriaceae bacterium SZ-1-7]|uniref:hypothetical protein n=1 Tax=Tamlana sedimenti TaxID=3134126 RepID=UPI0031288D57
MKTISLILSLFLAITIHAQNGSAKSNKNKTDRFSYSLDGLGPESIVVDVSGLKKSAMAAKAEEWVEEKYGDKKGLNREEDESDKGGKREKLRLEEFTDNAICFGTGADYGCTGLTYIVRLVFEDEEYEFIPTKITYKPEGSKKTVKINFNKSDFHANNGALNSGFENVPSQIEDLLNNLNKSLYFYLIDEEQKTEW